METTKRKNNIKPEKESQFHMVQIFLSKAKY